jgi:hypothetical protein
MIVKKIREIIIKQEHKAHRVHQVHKEFRPYWHNRSNRSIRFSRNPRYSGPGRNNSIKFY